MVDIDTKILRSFLSVASERSFSKAASRTACSQTTMSQRIRHLEQRLGVTLFQRAYHDVALTTAGIEMLPLAQAVVDKHDALVGRMRGSQVMGSVRLGIAEDYVLPMLSRLLKELQTAHPGIELSIVSGLSKHLAQQIDARTLDVAVVTLPAQGKSNHILAQPQLRWIAHPDYEHTANTPWPLALFPEGCEFRAAAVALLADKDILYREALVSPSGQVIQSAVSAGTAVSVMAEGTVPNPLSSISKAAGMPDLPKTCIQIIERARGLSQAGQTIRDLVIRCF